MTNYMGRARLEKILFKYISDRPDLIKSLRVAAKEYGKAMIFVYRKFRGSEWLECQENGFTFKIFADGSAGNMAVAALMHFEGEIGPALIIATAIILLTLCAYMLSNYFQNGVFLTPLV